VIEAPLSFHGTEGVLHNGLPLLVNIGLLFQRGPVSFQVVGILVAFYHTLSLGLGA
jgi:hypothetical protein